jgi:hypothetical protein
MGRQLTAAEARQLEDRIIDDPMMSDAELIHQRSKGNRHAGKIGATGNAMTRIGALCYIKHRLRHHEMAAEWFKGAYEAIYGGGMAPAIDPGRIQVDTTITAHDGGMAARLDGARSLQEVFGLIGNAARDRIIACIVLGIPAGSDAPQLPNGDVNQRRRKAAVVALLGDLDFVAELRGWKAAA